MVSRRLCHSYVINLNTACLFPCFLSIKAEPCRIFTEESNLPRPLLKYIQKVNDIADRTAHLVSKRKSSYPFLEYKEELESFRNGIRKILIGKRKSSYPFLVSRWFPRKPNALSRKEKETNSRFITKENSKRLHLTGIIRSLSL